MKVICVISNKNKQLYCLRNRNHLNDAADLLANVSNQMSQLVAHLHQKFKKRSSVRRLVENYNANAIYETLPTSVQVAYTENKGEKIALCLNTQKGGELIDLNTLTYVAVHELAHIATETIGHTDEFWSNFRFLLIEAVRINIYTPIDYSKHPQAYCGTTIDENILFDNDEQEITV